MTAAILELRPAAAPGIAPPKAVKSDLLRLFALDRLWAVPRRLGCRWRRDAEGRLCCAWEPDIGISLSRWSAQPETTLEREKSYGGCRI